MSFRIRFVSFLILTGMAAAQSAASRHEGKLLTDGSADTLWVELYDYSGHRLLDRAPVNRDGSFTVNAVDAQFYEVRVVTSRGDRVTSDNVRFQNGQPAEIRLPKTAAEGPLPAGPVSVRRLAHKPEKTARRLVREAETLASDGQWPASAERLEKALETDPNWFEVWNNLGSRRLRLGQYAEAATAFRRALAIDANDAIAHSNLGLALLFLREPAAAEEAANRALQLDPAYPQASYVAGLALLQQNKWTGEALSRLREAAKTLPRARLATAEWHCRHNDLTSCAADLRTFLRTPRGPNHEAAERWLEKVTRNMPGGQRP